LKFGEIFTDFIFIFAEFTCLRIPKRVMSTPTAALHLFSAVTNLLMVGKWFSEGFIGDLHRQLLFNITHRAPLPPLTPKNFNGWFLHAPGATTNKITSGGEVATHWLPSSSARSSPVPTRLRRVENPPQHCPPAAPPPPRAPPPRDVHTPLECRESAAER